MEEIGKLKEIKTKVDTFMVDCMCPKCKDGRLFAGPSKPGLQPGDVIVLHKCGKCGAMVDIKNKRYPYQEFRPCINIVK